MNNIAIKAENLSKLYFPGQINSGTLIRDFEKWLSKLRGLENPYLKIDLPPSKSHLWALKDINFEIHKGDIAGITGHNGSGKSTLLKILSRITAPTSGKIFGNGRITSLLEIGAGFHPELTGKENIYLNGAMLGMSRKEISKKLEEIIDYAGIESHLNTPVKRYSSGMYMRLAFSISSHLDSEILIIDEVLAVADVSFQKKCLDKIKEVARLRGVTTLLVSHNPEIIRKTCNKQISLVNGQLI